jgi:DNA-binding SARP family transcriptional activator/tetratricopeptide (TPR) repeat protein
MGTSRTVVQPGLWLSLLGQLSVCRDGTEVPIPAAKQRAVLGVLAVRAGQVVSFEELAETVWDGAPPTAYRPTLRGYVKRLRHLLGPGWAGRLVTRQPGYLLVAADDEVDLLLFDRACAEAAAAVQASAWPQASRLLGEALGLWRGQPLVDIASESLRRELLPRLEAQWLQATEWHVEVRLALGLHDELVAELTTLAGTHPLRERFHAQLMLALYRCGLPGEALAAYRQARSTLVDQLGVEPGAGLRALHQQILAADPALDAPPTDVQHPHGRTRAGAATAWYLPTSVVGFASPASGPVPRQLPADVAAFTGRAAPLAELDRLLARTGGGQASSTNGLPTAVVISAVSGTAGVGKTALAVHWAHRARERFPDGQLYVNLRGFDPGGRVMAPAEAVCGFLDALGVPAQRIPPTLDAQTALYRSMLDGRRVLVMLDNARDADQVRPLLPGAPTASVIVTSRNRLTSLVAACGAHPLTLDLLSSDEARQLITRRLGAGRPAEPQAVDEIVTRCARLPLALTIAAARATESGLPLAALATELADSGNRLDALSAGAAASDVRAVFSWSYTALTAAAARMFRLLGLHPGPDTSAAAAASVAGLPVGQAHELLVELARASLLAEHRPGRYSFHDLLRVYAVDLAHAHDTDDQRRAAVGRVLDHYLHTAHAAALLLNPHRDPPTLAPPAPGATPQRPTDLGQAAVWLSTERPVLLAILRQAADTGFDSHAWQLAWALTTFLDRQGHWHDLTAAWQAAVQSTGRLDDPPTHAYAHRSLARTYSRLGRYRDADAHHRHALDLYARAGDLTGQAHAHLGLADVSERQDRPDQALRHAQQALTLYQAAGHRRGQAGALNTIGWDHALLGDHRQALTCSQQALGLLQELGDRAGEAAAWDSLGYAHHHLGDHTLAGDCYQHALDLRHGLGHRYLEATTLTRLGDTHHTADHASAARAAWAHALDILADLGHPDADAVRAKLAGLNARAPKDAAVDNQPAHGSHGRPEAEVR